MKNERIMYKVSEVTKSYKKDCTEILECLAEIVVKFFHKLKKFEKIQLKNKLLKKIK